MPRSDLRRVGAVLFVALAFGITLSIVKGNGSGVRDTIGNISAPWLLLPFVAGALLSRGRSSTGAFVGVLATFTALAGFYVTNAFVLDLGPHPLPDDVRLAVEGGQRYFALALLSGPAFGALGGWWQQHRSMALAVMVTSLLIFEPLVWVSYARTSPARFDNHPAVWAAEVVVGLVACVFVAVGLRSRAGSTAS
jgi:hypothetical protein